MPIPPETLVLDTADPARGRQTASTFHRPASGATPHNGSPRRLLKEREAARFLRLSCGFLRASRLRVPRCSGPPFVRVGRAVRYDVRDLEEWVQQHRLVAGA
jgi:hypothetical protein